MNELSRQTLTVDDFIEIYTAIGWNPPVKEQALIALSNSHYTLCIKVNDKPIGMGRVTGDGAMSYDIKDIAVIPDYQGKGIGKIIIESILEYISHSTPYDVCAQLISTENKEGFYEKYGFGRKPGAGMGHGMMTLVKGQKR